MSEPIVPFTPPQAPEPEPQAVLKFGDVEIRLGLTYLHHLRNCEGWGDRHPNNVYFNADRTMDDAMGKIERAMWKAIDEGRK